MTREPSRGPAAPIRSWTDGYAALRARVGAVRGWIELDSDAYDRRWPRSTGLDVVVIAAFVDPYRRTDQAAWAGTALRWATCLHDIERDAPAALGSTYGGNRRFWTCLAMLCAHLAYVEAPLPSAAAWRAVLAQIGDDAPARNAIPSKDDPPVWFPNAGTADKLYQAQRKYLADLRGFDRLVPEAGMTGGPMPVPRSTVEDVRKLARFWRVLVNERRSQRANGFETVKARLEAAAAALAGALDPNAVYPKNHEFWRAVSSVAIHVAAAMEHGLTDDEVVLAAIGERIEPLADKAREVLHALGDGAAKVAEGVGNTANAAARGLLRGFATPLLIGGGALVGLFLLTRRREGGAS